MYSFIWPAHAINIHTGAVLPTIMAAGVNISITKHPLTLLIIKKIFSTC